MKGWYIADYVAAKVWEVWPKLLCCRPLLAGGPWTHSNEASSHLGWMLGPLMKDRTFGGRKAIRKPSTRFGNQGPRFGNHDSETRDPDRFGNQETTIRKPNWKLRVFVMVMVG